MVGVIVLLIALGVLIYLTMRGVNVIIAAIISSLVLAIFSGMNPEQAISKYYMEGFSDYFASWFIVFLLGAIFGKIMEDTRSAEAVANWFSSKLGAQRAVFAVVFACAVMTYGGVSLFVVGFSVYPIAYSLFKKANHPHRFIPGALAFGSIAFTMTSPGSPEIQNIIPTDHFGTGPMAGGWIGILIGVLIAIAGTITINKSIKNAVERGEEFSPPKEKETNTMLNGENNGTFKTPHVISAVLPLVVIVVVLNVLSTYMYSTGALIIALTAGIFLLTILNIKFITQYWNSLAVGSRNSLIAIANTCAVVGFGSVAAETSAFNSFVQFFINMPGPPLLGLGLGATIIVGVTGSAAGGLEIALPLLAPYYLSQGVDPGAMHRVSALASGALDSLPHNGFTVTTIRAITGETHKRAYKEIFKLCVVIPLIAMLLAILLYSIPGLQ